MAIDVVARQWGLTVTKVRYPEDEKPPPDRPLDVVAEMNDGTTIVIEHTLHLTYEGQIEEGTRLEKQLAPLVERLSGTLPLPGRYDLGIRIRAIDGAPRLDEAQIERWITETAPTLGLGGTHRGPSHYATAGPPSIPIPLSLYRWLDGPQGELTLGRLVDNERLDVLRRERARAALAKKLPKLAEQRPMNGRSVLVLENPDMSLVNTWNTATAVKGALEDAPDLPHPDAILLVNTIGPRWWIDWLKDGRDWYPELQRHSIEADPRVG